MISQTGINLIREFEGFSEREYVCPAGKRTIGYGHVCKDDEHYPNGITPSEAEIMLLDDIQWAENCVTSLLLDKRVPLSGCQYDALVSFVYNVGTRAFEHSTLYNLLLSKKYDEASDEFPRWCYCNGKESRGLKNRRMKEQELFKGELL